MHRMYVCLCNGVTEREIRQVAEAGCRTVSELTMRTGCGASCGSCLEMATQVLEGVHAALPAADVVVPLSVLSHAA
jgi:bacterioferritin-associated ferredoxin